MMNLIEEHLSYAHAIAAEMLKKLPMNVDRSEIESAAELGLVQAARAYDPSRSIPFTTFAYYRIRGAICDDVRQAYRANKVTASWAIRDYARDVSVTDQKGNDRAGYSASVPANYMMSLEALPTEPVSLTAVLPLDHLLRKEQRKHIRDAMQLLPQKNVSVLKAYYYQGLSFEEIGRRMGLSKSWVSRIHAKSLNLLQRVLRTSQPSGREMRVSAASRTAPGAAWQH